MPKLSVFVKGDDDVTRTRCIVRNFSCRVSSSGAEDAVTEQARKSAAGMLHAHMCSIRVSCGSILFCDVIQCPAYSASPFGVFVPCHSFGVLFQ